MPETEIRRSFSTSAEFAEAIKSMGSAKVVDRRLEEIAIYVEDVLARDGFRLFHNGGLPLLKRNRSQLSDEIVFSPAPSGTDFSVRVHLNHEGVGAVRAKFWRPATRAPKTIASADIGLLEANPKFLLWSTLGHARTANAVATLAQETLIPWLDLFDDPPRLREALELGEVPLVDLSTATEIMLAEFDVREARRFLRSQREPDWPPVIPVQQAGFELQASRMAALTAYYRL